MRAKIVPDLPDAGLSIGFVVSAFWRDWLFLQAGVQLDEFLGFAKDRTQIPFLESPKVVKIRPIAESLQ